MSHPNDRSPVESGQIFRIFVSSTFDDLRAEREALQRSAFEELRERCREQGCRFQAIDLRWGISQEASEDQRTMSICLEEIRRCQSVTPRPNFLILMGDRYGWCPLPDAIPADAFLEIKQKVGASAGQRLMDRWYRRDDNADPAVFCLTERTAEFLDPVVWEAKVERPLHRIMLDAVERLDLGENIDRLFASATEQEIRSGLLGSPGAETHTFCFQRILPAGPSVRDADRYVERDGRRAARLIALRRRLSERLGTNFREFQADVTGGELSRDHLRPLCDQVRDALWEVISRQIHTRRARSPLELECAGHREFALNRSRSFTGRQAVLDTLRSWIARDPGHPIVLHGASGCGKSAVMAELAKRIPQFLHPEAKVVERYIGATAASVDIRQLLGGVCAELADEDARLELDYQQLVKDFRSGLIAAGQVRATVVLIDAVDQLSTAERARELAWLPSTLPSGVSVVVSTTPGDMLKALSGRLPDGALIPLHGMPPAESERLLKGWLADAGRRLTRKQRSLVRAAFAHCDLPLYFHLVFQQARRWRCFDLLAETALAPDIPGIIRDVLDRLSQPDQHGKALVDRSLAYLAAARNGLTEDELLDVLAEDDDVMAAVEKRSFHALPERRLPAVIWSRLYFDLDHYLSRRSVDGTQVLGFFHRQLEDAVRQRCLGDRAAERSAHLARYFEARRLERRGVSELPYAQAQAGMSDGFEKTMTAFDFVAARIGFSGCQALIDDYGLAGKESGWPGVIQAALRRSASWVSRDPKQLAGQLVGRLLDHEGELVQRLVRQAGRWRDTIWLRPLHRSLSSGGAWVRTLTHDGNITDFAVTHDGSRLLSASSDHTVRIWDAPTGAELHRLDHGRAVTSLAISPDQRLVVSHSRGAIRLWDINTGAEVRRLARPRMPTAYLLAVSDDRRHLTTITASGIRVWHVADGSYDDIRVQSMSRCALSGDGRRVLVAQKRQVKFFDLDKGRMRPLKVPGGVDQVAISAGGQTAVVASSLGRYHVWRLDQPDQPPLCIDAGHRAYSLSIDSNGQRCLAVLAGGELNYRDLSGGKPIVQVSSPHARAAVAPDDGSFAVVVVGRRMLQMLDMAPGAADPRPPSHESRVTAVAISPDGRKALSGSADGRMLLWHVHEAAESQPAGWHDGEIMALAFDPSGSRFVSAGKDRQLLIHEGVDREPRDYRLDATSVLDMTLTSEGVAVAITGARNGGFRVWRFGSKRLVTRVPAHRRSVRAAALSPEAKRLVSAGGDRRLCFWDLSAGSDASCVEFGNLVRHLAISDDGRHAAAGLERSLRLSDPANATTVKFIGGHAEKVQDVAMSGDGARVVSAGRDGRLCLWDTSGGELLAVFQADSAIICCALSADGQTVVAGDELGAVHLLRVEGPMGDTP